MGGLVQVLKMLTTAADLYFVGKDIVDTFQGDPVFDSINEVLSELSEAMKADDQAKIAELEEKADAIRKQVVADMKKAVSEYTG